MKLDKFINFYEYRNIIEENDAGYTIFGSAEYNTCTCFCVLNDFFVVGIFVIEALQIDLLTVGEIKLTYSNDRSFCKLITNNF